MEAVTLQLRVTTQEAHAAAQPRITPGIPRPWLCFMGLMEKGCTKESWRTWRGHDRHRVSEGLKTSWFW